MPSRLQLIAAAFIIANTLGYVLVGPKFVGLGWLINVPCGLLHYFAIERPNDAGDPFGTAVICSIPWAQTLLTGFVVIGGALWIAAWTVQQWWLGEEWRSPRDSNPDPPE